MNILNLKIMKKMNSSFIIYADFESVLEPEDNGKQNSEESYKSKYQKHIACIYGLKLVCADDQFSKPFKAYLGKDVIYNFFGSIIEESKYSSDVVKKYLSKEFAITKGNNEGFKNSTTYWICDNAYIDNDVELIDHCHITRKYRGSVHRHCNVNLKLSYKIPVIFYNLKNY